ncbi:MAG TPA: hypothetical protein VJ349_26535, partial [Stellaceae bacterium]|nr:hypothetical protein [Stellaceae bacterium]
IEASFAEELSGLQNSDHGFLALFGDDENLDPSLLNIENCISDVSLGKNDLVFLNFNMTLPSPTLARKLFGSNKLFSDFGMKSSAPDRGQAWQI